MSSSTPSAVSGHSCPSGWPSATSSCRRMLASGLRSSWAASEIRARWEASAASSRASMSLSVVASSCTSSRASGTGSRRALAVPLISAAPRRSAVIGRSVRPMISQLAAPSSTRSTGVPTTSMWTVAARLSATSLKDRAAITVLPWSACRTTTRSGPGMPYGPPSTNRPRPSGGSSSRARALTSGTRRSAPSVTWVMRPRSSSTWMIVPSGTATGSDSRPSSARATTSLARW